MSSIQLNSKIFLSYISISLTFFYRFQEPNRWFQKYAIFMLTWLTPVMLSSVLLFWRITLLQLFAITLQRPVMIKFPFKRNDLPCCENNYSVCLSVSCIWRTCVHHTVHRTCFLLDMWHSSIKTIRTVHYREGHRLKRNLA